jgi:hypothetical protein
MPIGEKAQAYERARRARVRAARLAAGACVGCGGGRREGYRRCSACLDKRNAERRRWRANRPQIEKAGRLRRHRATLGTKQDRNRIYKDLVYAYYGGYLCVCCGETDPTFLTLDHVDNDGNVARKVKGYKSARYYWIWKNHFPERLQVLCYNCNCGRQRNGGICPHKQKKQEAVA